MAIHRTKSLGTKVTEDEYAQCQAWAGTLTLSEWARTKLLRAAPDAALLHTVLAEVLALRTIVLNLQFATATGHALTPDDMQALIDRADQDKWGKVAERAAADGARRRV
jgi:hypothetical protein